MEMNQKIFLTLLSWIADNGQDWPKLLVQRVLSLLQSTMMDFAYGQVNILPILLERVNGKMEKVMW